MKVVSGFFNSHQTSNTLGNKIINNGFDSFLFTFIEIAIALNKDNKRCVLNIASTAKIQLWVNFMSKNNSIVLLSLVVMSELTNDSVLAPHLAKVLNQENQLIQVKKRTKKS